MVEKLRREILLGRIQPGARLPPERELAQRFATNRNTLREALRTLESENLVRARQGDGTLVCDWRSSGEMSLLPHYLDEVMNEERFSALITLLHLRQALVEQALGYATEEADDVDLRALREALERLRNAAPGLPTLRAEIEFYRRIVVTAHSVVLVWVFNTFARIFEQLGARYPGLWGIDKAAYTDRLEEVVRSMVAGRGDRAREQMRELLDLRNADLLAELVPPGDGFEVMPPQNAKPKTRRKRK